MGTTVLTACPNSIDRPLTNPVENNDKVAEFMNKTD